MSRRIRSVTHILFVAIASLVQFQAVAQSQELSTEQTDQQTRLQAAATELNTGSYNDGVSQLNALLDEYPTLVSGWILLGRTQRSKSEFEESLDTFTRGNTANPSNPAMMFQLGIAHGHTGNLDQSFKYLLATKRTNSINMTNLAALPVAAKLSGDPRYRDVFPTEVELNDPFVEGTRIIHEWRGEHARDQFSWIARNIGDVDGDEVDDLVASAPTSRSPLTEGASGPTSKSASRLYIGRPLLRSHTLAVPPPVIRRWPSGVTTR